MEVFFIKPIPVFVDLGLNKIFYGKDLLLYDYLYS